MVSGNNLIVTYNIQFNSSFAGIKTIWTNAYSATSLLGSPFQSAIGATTLSWTVPGATIPSLVSFSPESGSGIAQSFTAVYSSPVGGGDILSTQVLFNAIFTASNSCYFGYDRNSNRFLLLNDAGTAWLAGGAAPGSGSVSNSQCTILGNASSATISGNNLTVIYNVQFAPAFAGAKTIWTNSYSASSLLGSAWQSSVSGPTLTWTVP